MQIRCNSTLTTTENIRQQITTTRNSRKCAFLTKNNRTYRSPEAVEGSRNDNETIGDQLEICAAQLKWTNYPITVKLQDCSKKIRMESREKRQE